MASVNINLYFIVFLIHIAPLIVTIFFFNFTHTMQILDFRGNKNICPQIILYPKVSIVFCLKKSQMSYILFYISNCC